MASTQLPQAFITKKSTILSDLATPQDQYTDKSPKGSIDTPIQELIAEINAIDGLVTTSSCSGRVAVFVEGPKSIITTNEVSTQHQSGESDNNIDNDDNEEVVSPSQDQNQTPPNKKTSGGPGGKGGGKWLYVSHEAINIPDSKADSKPDNYFTKLCGLNLPQHRQRENTQQKDETPSTREIPRLIRLSFSPLILHVLTASLAEHARPLLAAAINAGFRESGVQSLAGLEGNNKGGAGVGTMVAIRTAGLAFETIIGRVVTRVGSGGEGEEEEEEIMEAMVDESYLALCFGVINERFEWNEGRKERLRREIERGFRRDDVGGGGNGERYESKEVRRRRKREEGLKRQAEVRVKEEEKLRGLDGDNIDNNHSNDSFEDAVL